MARLSSLRANDVVARGSSEDRALSPVAAGAEPSRAPGRPVECDGFPVGYDGPFDRDGLPLGGRGGLARVVERVERVAPTEVPVLLQGETGSGKEVVAQFLHARSRRSEGPMVRVNCGAIPPELVDSELFGHERGAFTGASALRQGWFERADGGTLLLDEVAELTPAAQVRLLRVLAEGTIQRVGGARPIHVSVRVVAATLADLRALAARGLFREDLWYRLSVFTVHLPALRDRLEDVPAMAAHFAAAAGRRLGTGPIALDAEALDALLAHPWPGNVRELAAVVERAAILGGGARLDVRAALADGPLVVRDALRDEERARSGPAAARAASPSSEVGPVEGGAGAPFAPFPTLDEAVRAHVTRALVHAEGRIEGPRGAAALLGVNPFTLRGKMRKLGLDWARYRGAPPSSATAAASGSRQQRNPVE